MSESLDAYVSNLKSMAMLLLSICESMDGIEHINLHADIEDGIPYVNFAAFGKDHDEPTLSWSAFIDDGEENDNE